jgi:hypothetical protein
MVRSCDPEAKQKGCDGLKRTEVAHFEWPLNVLVGLDGSRRSQRRTCPSSWAERMRLPLLSMLVTTESLVRNVYVVAIFAMLVIVIRCWLEPATTSSLLTQFKHSTVPSKACPEANKGRTFRFTSFFFFLFLMLLLVPSVSKPSGICQMLISPFDPPVAKWLSAPGLIEMQLIEPLWGLEERRVVSEPLAKLTR